MTQILIVEDHWLFATAVEREVRRLQPEAECTRVASLGDALTLLRLGRRYDLALVDLKLPDAQGLSAIEAIRRDAPSTKVAVISAYDDARTMREAYRLEAVGYLSKSAAPESFERGLQLLLSGGFFYPSDVLEGRGSAPYGLTPREGDVLDQLVRGMTSKQIARKLGLAPATVDKHVEQIRVKLGARSRIQLLARLGDLYSVRRG